MTDRQKRLVYSLIHDSWLPDTTMNAEWEGLAPARYVRDGMNVEDYVRSLGPEQSRALIKKLMVRRRSVARKMIAELF
jgi:hypothetical protein